MTKRIPVSTNKEFAEGIELLANTVGSTYGPGGSTVIIEREHGNPIITKDGVTVTRNYAVKDRLQNMAVTILKESAERTLRSAGDGTTSTILLASAMYLSAASVNRDSININQFVTGMRTALTGFIVPVLKSLTQKVESNEDIRSIALVSTNNDVILTDTIMGAFDSVGVTGVVVTEEHSGLDDIVEITTGYSFDEGYMNPVFVNNKAKLTVEYDDAYVLVLEQKLSSVLQIEDILIEIRKANKPLIILAPEFEKNIIPILGVNKLEKGLEVVPLLLTGVGDNKRDYAKDIASYTGATSINSNDGIKFSDIRMESHLGKVKNVIITDHSTTFIGYEEESAPLLDRRKNLSILLDGTTSEFEKGKLEHRLGKLNGKVANIKLAAKSSSEFRERKDRFDDAIAACKTANKHGIVAGSTCTYLFLSIVLDRSKSPLVDKDLGCKGYSDSFLLGYDVVINSLRILTAKLLENLGESEHFAEELFSVLSEAYTDQDDSFGYGFTIDVHTMSLQPMQVTKIYDPMEVVLEAISNAVSTSTTLLTSKYALKLEEK